MADRETIRVGREGPVTTVVLDRPKIHNAFNDVMLAELTSLFDEIGSDETTRVLVITGAGKSFCAGADLAWMKRMVEYGYEDNLKDSRRLADCMHKLDRLPKPTVAMVNGAAIGGGMGLVTACDIAVASDKAVFGLSEVRLGIAPAVISPFVIRKAGRAVCRELFLTGERLSAERALAAGLVNRVVPHDELGGAVGNVTDMLLKGGPEALRTCKELVARVPSLDAGEEKEATADIIARLRVSDEGQEGMGAFLEKRTARWREESK